jgi:hypothetical protein
MQDLGRSNHGQLCCRIIDLPLLLGGNWPLKSYLYAGNVNVKIRGPKMSTNGRSRAGHADRAKSLQK